ncbi:DUF4003 domain-containing protein [Mesobacillus boroniphilus]|uniref:DUF4003 domain-containing protein n=1 Tax=Mesobacillus boroniphilus TaxID=308892 RepID=A0A944CNU5_9BACI|nr:DUF4003 family protein [Mesobacillus boroniphilus]MBS8266400.1 DUF4003 domain-containing protein [Mesobacillus boroniphilus]
MDKANRNIENYILIYSQLRERYRWKVTDQSVLMMVASLYISNNRTFDMNRFTELAEFIKSESGIFSPLRSESRFTFAAMLDTRFESPKEKFPAFIAAYNALVSEGFSKNTFTYIAAMQLVTANLVDLKSLSERARAIYKKMREEHLFLTGHSDYPLAVMLAQHDRQTDEMISYIEDLYSKLSQNGFRKGNDLQSMSHILSLNENSTADDMVALSTEIYDRMKKEGIKPKSMFYPQIALLTLIEKGNDNLSEIKAIWEQLNAEKLFKWKKDINFMMAVNFVISDKVEHSPLLQTNLSTTIETLIQAQQAASIAAISSAAVVASSSGGE